MSIYVIETPHHICKTYALDAPMFARGDRSTPFKTIAVMVYMVQRGVCPPRIRKFSMTAGRFV